MKEARKTNRIYDPKSVELKVEGKRYKVHSMSYDGIGFFTEDPLPFKVSGSVSVSLELCGIPMTVDGVITHVSMISELRSNIPIDENSYLCGVKFVFQDKDSQESITKFLDAQAGV